MDVLRCLSDSQLQPLTCGGRGDGASMGGGYLDSVNIIINAAKLIWLVSLMAVLLYTSCIVVSCEFVQ